MFDRPAVPLIRPPALLRIVRTSRAGKERAVEYANIAAASVSTEEPKITMKRLAFASVIGTTVEWYDLFVFATASALVFNKVFFPSVDPRVGTLLAFGTFAAAYLARIVGAALFGHFGDRLGRKSMLLFSLIMMGIATFAIGLLPNYDAIGIWAPILLLTLRILQGLALGGEWGGAVLMAVEHAPANRRGVYGSWVQIGVPAGTLIANLVFLLMAGAMANEDLLSWGWRVPFLASALLVAIGLYVRLNTAETPTFKIVKATDTVAKVPFLELFVKSWKFVLLGGVACMSTGSSFTLIVAFGLNYGTQALHISRNGMLGIVMISCAVCVVLLPLFGWLSDRVGRRPVIVGGILAEAVVAFPMFWLMDTQTFAGALAGYLLMMAAFAANYGPIATYLAELFGTKVRYSGLSISYMLSGVLGSATTPVITTWLLTATGKGSSVAWYMIGSALISAAALMVLTETAKKDLTKDA